MGDVENRQAFVAHSAQYIKKSRCIFTSETAGGFIKDEHRRLAVEGAGDLDDLTVGDGQIDDACIEGDVRVLQARQGRGGLGLNSCRFEPAEAGRFAAKKQGLGDG